MTRSKLTSRAAAYQARGLVAAQMAVAVRTASAAKAAQAAIANVEINVTGGSGNTIADNDAAISAITTRLDNAGIPP